MRPSESRVFTDLRSGVIIRQVTGRPPIHHHPFYYLPAFDDAMTRRKNQLRAACYRHKSTLNRVFRIHWFLDPASLAPVFKGARCQYRDAREDIRYAW